MLKTTCKADDQEVHVYMDIIIGDIGWSLFKNSLILKNSTLKVEFHSLFISRTNRY